MIKLKSSKSLLRYPGGKSRGAEKIFEFIRQADAKEICSPFLGGGSVDRRQRLHEHGDSLHQRLIQ